MPGRIDFHADDWGFHVRIFGPAIPPGVILKFPPFPENQQGPVLESIRSRMRTDKPTLRGDLKIPGYPPLTMLIERPLHTSAVVHWIRGAKREGNRMVSGRLPAASALLSGRDAKADDSALHRVAELCAQGRLPVLVEQVFGLRKDERPLAALFCRDGAVKGDPSIYFGFTLVAQAFFEHCAQ
ncbi:MAG: hypothetical protein ACREJC_16920 [Tepidisphaeraceae bacterium]